VVACAPALGRRTIRWAIGIGIVAFALAPPLLSLDVFSYISYARLGAVHGLNPYEFAPAAIPHDLAAVRVEDNRDIVSVYGPLFTLATYPVGLLGTQAALWVLKLVSAVSVAGLVVLVGRLAAARGLPPARAAAFVALNPLVLVHVVGGPHNDALMMLALVGGVGLVYTGRELSGAAAIVVAAAIKTPAALLAPFALAAREPRRGRLVAGLALAAVALGALALAVFGAHATHALSFLRGTQDVTSYHSVPATLSRIADLDLAAVRTAFAIAYALLVTGLLVWTARGGDWIRAGAWAVLGLLLATAYVTPWYLIWALPLVAVARDRAAVALTLALSAYQLAVGVPV
jgi:alpha-1,6-mannosyltransferase